MYSNNTRNPHSKSSKKRKHEIIGTAIRVGGRVVGQVIGLDYTKDITNRHILQKPFPAIANNLQALHDAERAGAVNCVFTNTDTGVIYRASIALIWEKGTRINYGYGEQIALALPYWLQARGTGYIIPLDPPTGGDPNASGVVLTDSPSWDAQPYPVKSRAITGVHYKPGRQTPRQMSLFSRGW